MARLRRALRTQIKDNLRATLSLLKSFRHKDWALEDYPIKVIKRSPQQLEPLGRFKLSPWTAQVIRWWLMRGDGDTREEAISKLQRRFGKFKANATQLPRPGTQVKPKIEFAPTKEINKHIAIVDDLMVRVMGFEPESYLITDESSLWDFHTEGTNEPYLRKIMLFYGIDVSDIDPPTIAAIAQRIYESRNCM
jgi:hypothetical protein